MQTRSREMTNDERLAICTLHESGLSYREIATKISRPRSTISSVVTKFRKRGFHEKLRKTGRKEKLSDRDQRRLLRKMRADGKISKRKLLVEFNEEIDKQISKRTLDRYTDKLAIMEKVSRKTHKITERKGRDDIRKCSDRSSSTVSEQDSCRLFPDITES